MYVQTCVCMSAHICGKHAYTHIHYPTHLPIQGNQKKEGKKSTVISKLELKLVWSLAQRTRFQTECEMHLGGLHDSHEVMSSTSVGPST